MTFLREYFSRIPRLILWMAALYALAEIALTLGDANLFNMPRFRSTVYEYAGFWPGLLDNWEPNYLGQPALMFLTYGFLHSGVLHLVVNMITLASLGPPVIERVGNPKFLFIYAISITGGAIGFALLSDTFRPMVGASGALFGLAGAVIAWEYIDRFTLREALWPVVRAVAFLIALNVVLYYAMDKLLAWEAHLGGFILGWIAAVIVDPRSRRDGDLSP